MPTLPPRPLPFFIGSHLALDFLNTAASPAGVPTEWLRDGADLLDWLVRAGVVSATLAGGFRGRSDLDQVAARARAFRGWLREFVDRHAGKVVGGTVVRELGPLNALLARDDSRPEVVADGGRLAVRRARRWARPEELVQPLADAAADLVCRADFRLVRACEGAACTLVFLDRTRSHARRWCSMAACGNRAKAAAHRARARGSGG